MVLYIKNFFPRNGRCPEVKRDAVEEQLESHVELLMKMWQKHKWALFKEERKSSRIMTA